MGMKKNPTTTAPAAQVATTVQQPAPSAGENGTAAAISRLKKSSEPTTDKKPSSSGGRDYNEEARGKTRCAQFEAALASPAIAGMKFETMEQYLALCKQAADYGTSYTFGELPPK